MSKYRRELHDQDIVDDMKINSKDFFELVYLRHRYFRKSENPRPGRLEKYEKTIQSIASNMYYKNSGTFKAVGFEREDLENIARVHTVSFFYLSGLEENPDKYEAFRKRHKKKYGNTSEPDENDVFRKETYDLVKFLYQRMQETVNFSNGKIKNIRGTSDLRGYFIGNGKFKPSDFDLIKFYKNYGFEKISEKEYKKLEKQYQEEEDEMLRLIVFFMETRKIMLSKKKFLLKTLI